MDSARGVKESCFWIDKVCELGERSFGRSVLVEKDPHYLVGGTGVVGCGVFE